MKEDYLKYLTTSDSYMGYPLWTTNPCSENYLLDNFISMATLTVVKPKIKDISFIKKKVPRFNILKDSIPLIVTLPSGIDVEMMDYFKKTSVFTNLTDETTNPNVGLGTTYVWDFDLYNSLRVPKEYLFETLTYDEFH